jgi:hypothetical protein
MESFGQLLVQLSGFSVARHSIAGAVLYANDCPVTRGGFLECTAQSLYMSRAIQLALWQPWTTEPRS